MLAERKWQPQYYEQTAEKNKPVAVPKPRGRFKKDCLLFIAACTAMAMIITLRSESIVNKGNELINVKSRVMTIEKENEQLRLQIARLKSPQRIQEIATAQLGMIVPERLYCAAADVRVKESFERRMAVSAVTTEVSSERAGVNAGR